ncbi:hypothetical protein FUA26_14215 [Seonamhaeicola algicola]|uniref:Tetratricopeptide repeat protein n=1 Tax=Seonamhaeicola algicola TaxID=1719036 RepID=A0A5C7ABF6_9FLAO|nr:hypothetical protein [Seonamhaeicola algicola]TXE06130.1 hypothetical protein FUA26_14215 [Seonamhaeicola algicola]
MNSSQLTNILQNPQQVTHQQTDALQNIVNEFPYFQAARAIYLKGLKNQSSLKYNQALKTTAAYTTDRSILFDFITSEAFSQNEISQIIKRNSVYLNNIDVDSENINVNRRVIEDEILKQHINDTKDVLDPALFQPKEPQKKAVNFSLDTSESISNVTKNDKETTPSPSEILNLGQPLQFNKNEKHSFNEWLKLTRFKPIERKNINNKTAQKQEEAPQKSIQKIDSEKAKKFELIDKFITNTPKITPSATPSKKGNLAKAQMVKPEALMTETLARIYVEQKNFKKAIQSYKILSLKYPEKSSFFANQIKAVEQLQKQNNKE